MKIMNYYEGLKKIAKTGEFDKIPTALLIDYVKDFTNELNARQQVKILDTPLVSECVEPVGEGTVCPDCNGDGGYADPFDPNEFGMICMRCGGSGQTGR